MNVKVIDFHSHILPGIDDGSPNVKTSLEMLHIAQEQGVDVQVLTPHYYPWKEDIDHFFKRRTDSFQRLQNELSPALPLLLCGAEVAFFPHLTQLDISELKKLCIGNSNVLLLEMPFESWNNQIFDQIATLSLERELKIVLAHIERFLHYKGNREQLDRLSHLPLHMQVNAEVFMGFFMRRKILPFIQSGQVTILGSDAHNLTSRRPNLAVARKWIEKHFGDAILSQMDKAAYSLLEQEILNISVLE